MKKPKFYKKIQKIAMARKDKQNNGNNNNGNNNSTNNQQPKQTNQ